MPGNGKREVFAQGWIRIFECKKILRSPIDPLGMWGQGNPKHNGFFPFICFKLIFPVLKFWGKLFKTFLSFFFGFGEVFCALTKKGRAGAQKLRGLYSFCFFKFSRDPGAQYGGGGGGK